jgi:hypothetical protein
VNSQTASVLAMNFAAGVGVAAMLFAFSSLIKSPKFWKIVGLAIWLAAFAATPRLSYEPIGELLAMTAGGGLVALVMLYRVFGFPKE